MEEKFVDVFPLETDGDEKEANRSVSISLLEAAEDCVVEISERKFKKSDALAADVEGMEGEGDAKRDSSRISSTWEVEMTSADSRASA